MIDNFLKEPDIITITLALICAFLWFGILWKILTTLIEVIWKISGRKNKSWEEPTPSHLAEEFDIIEIMLSGKCRYGAHCKNSDIDRPDYVRLNTIKKDK